jgi:hypothetical protein
MILDYGHRYTHPVTGEVYGRTDYDDPAKLAEIGAFLLTMYGPADGMSADGWEIVPVGDGYVRRPTGETPIPVPLSVPPSDEVLQFRREYLDTTAALCAIAGEPYTGKLTSLDFKRISLAGATNPLTGVLVGSIVYLRTVLRELDGVDWFDNIEGL